MSTFEKGEKGKLGRWVHSPVVGKIGKTEKKESLKEKPQYKVIEHYEAAALENYQSILKTQATEIIQFLKKISQ